MADGAPRILCVDDDPAVLEVLKEHFTLEGFDVLTATDGAEAFLQVWRCRPKAVILDLFMPRLGGLGTLDRIRRLDASIVVILISGVPHALEMVTEAGVSVAGAFTKPVNLAQLSDALARAGVVPVRTPAAARGDLPLRARRSVRHRVLVVDDDAEVRAMLGDYLESKGFEVLQVADGEEALRQIPEFRPRVILLDIAMPGLSGVEALRGSRLCPRKPVSSWSPVWRTWRPRGGRSRWGPPTTWPSPWISRTWTRSWRYIHSSPSSIRTLSRRRSCQWEGKKWPGFGVTAQAGSAT